MNEPREEKLRPLFDGEFVWASNSADGKFKPYLGPNGFLIGNEDTILMPDPDNEDGIIVVEKEQAMRAVQRFTTLSEGEYAIIHNPAAIYEPDYPNGKWASGRTDIPPLKRGATRVVVKGSFPRWPGQKIEVRQAYTLAPDQYLVVRVVSDDIDVEAPYYNIVMQCAEITTAVVEAVDKSEKSSTSKDIVDAAKNPTTHKLVVGQRIIIPGNITPQFIPPTGIEVVADTTPQVGVEDLAGLPDHEIIRKAIEQNIVTAKNILGILNQEVDAVTERESGSLEYELSKKSYDLFTVIANALSGRTKSQLAKFLRPRLVAPTPQPSSDLYRRQAKTPKATQFCTLIDEKGEPKNVKGPGRVFPGPNDTFRTEGTTDGIYNAYHIRSDRGILLRVVAKEISKTQLSGQLPFGAAAQLEKDIYRQGEEIFLSGFDAYLVPSSDLEVIDPSTRQPHIGNSHAGIYVEAIPVDQKSGVYVRQVETGNVPLVRGERKLLLDPRKEVHEKRQVPPYVWNLLIGAGEPHKKVSEDGNRVITPWALSVLVPNNEAMLLISRKGRRPVIGPCTELLDYEEVPEVLTLSRGQVKTDKDLLRTCFLRVNGNHVTDTVEIEPSGGVTKLKIIVSYGVHFVTQAPDETEVSEEVKTERMIAWFNDKNYVQLLADNTRSRLRAKARARSLEELYLRTEEFVRDTILGEKPPEGHRPGLLFKENWMLVYEVNVLSVSVPEERVAEALEDTQREVTIAQINSTAEESKLEFAKQKAERDSMLKDLELADITHKGELELARIESLKQAREAEQKAKDDLAAAVQVSKNALAKAQQEADGEIAEMRRQGLEADERSRLGLLEERRDKVLVLRNALANIEKDLMDADAKATATKLEAIQAGLVEAIEGLGDKQVLAELAKSMPEATGSAGYLLGLGGLAGLLNMIGGSTNLANRLRDIMKSPINIEKEADTDLDSKSNDPSIKKE